MLAIRNGIHMVFIREGSVLKIKPNPKFVRNDVAYGAIILNETPIGVYPLVSENEYTDTVYSVYNKICDALANDMPYINMPYSYRFKSADEFKEFTDLLEGYNNNELFSMYYDSLKEAKNAKSN